MSASWLSDILALYFCLITFCFWQVDNTDDPLGVKMEAEKKGAICISAIHGDGLQQFCGAVQAKLRVPVAVKKFFLKTCLIML